MLVLSGAQNMGKSTLAAWLCALPEMFIESSINPDSNDHLRYLVTRWIWEVSELGATTRRSDREALKAFLTRQEATFRKPYDHHPTIKPALASFIGTVNPMNSGFLDDPTGSRRFLVVDLASIDHSYAKTVNRDQLWAQVMAAYQADPQAWRLTPEEQAKRDTINAENEVERPYEGIITHIFDVDPIRTDWWMSTKEIVDAVRTYGDAVFDETRHHGVLGSTLRGLGLERKQTRVGADRVWGYYGIQIRAQYLQGPSVLP
jgi:predicted P-loop ATPase